MRKHQIFALFLASLFLVFALFAGCQSEEDKKFDELTKASSAPPASSQTGSPEEEELSGKLSIMADMEFDRTGVSAQAKRFMEQHPGVEIEVEYGLDVSDEAGSAESYYAKVDQYLQRIATRVMGGDPPDVLVSGIFPVEKYTASGLLTDMYPLMDADGLVRDAFYGNILSLYEHDGSLYVLPGSFTVSACMLNRSALAAAGVEEPETVDYAFLSDTYEAARQSGAMPTLKSLDAGQVMGKNTLDSLEYPLYMDFEGKTAGFTSPEFLTYLEKTARNDTTVTVLDGFSNADIPGDGTNPVGEYFVTPNDSLAVITALDPQKVIWLEPTDEGATGLIPLANSKGQVCASSSECMAIPVGSENKELAWEFVKFCMDGTAGFPIRKDACRKELKESYAYSDEDIEKAEAFIAKAAARPLGDQKFIEIIRSDLGDYYDRGLLSAEDCAKKLQDKAEMYLNE